MAGSNASSWANVASRNVPTAQQAQSQTQNTTSSAINNPVNGPARPRRRSPSPAHQPTRESEDEDVYVLTVLTDKPHHDRMTALRQQYFPKRINKLAAHLTLFHALPGSKLDSQIMPHIQQVASQTAPFKVRATRPFRLKKGIALGVARDQGGSQAQEVHRQLQSLWKQQNFLSEQDAGGCRVHYTIMNKVDDEAEIEKAMAEVQASWKDDVGTAEGLALWRYDRGWWRWERKFAFTSRSHDAT